MAIISLPINVEETTYEAPSNWRLLGASGKSEHVVKLCERQHINPERLLEVGAGDGAILRRLAERNFCSQMFAVEISQSGVDVIEKQRIPGLISCKQFDGYSIPFEDKYFDIVVLSHVLEHVEYERALLREIRRVSRYQVIEIPMDCNALNDETYHLLGPSYGHINAHTPDSFRFLLSTEGFSIIDDLLGEYSLELQEHLHFVENDRERTPETVSAFRKSYQERESQFLQMPREAQIKRSSFYAVLTSEEDIEARLNRALVAAEKSIGAGRTAEARLIFNHYVPSDFLVQSSLRIVRAARETNARFALEFVDRVLAVDPENDEALSIRDSLTKSA